MYVRIHQSRQHRAAGEISLDRVADTSGLGYTVAAPRGEYPAVFNDNDGALDGIRASPVDEAASSQD